MKYLKLFEEYTEEYTKSGQYVFVHRDHLGQSDRTVCPNKESADKEVMSFVNQWIEDKKISDYVDDPSDIVFETAEQASNFYNEWEWNSSSGEKIFIEPAYVSASNSSSSEPWIVIETDHMGEESHSVYKSKVRAQRAILKIVNDYIDEENLDMEDIDGDPNKPLKSLIKKDDKCRFTDAEEAMKWYNENDNLAGMGFHIELQQSD